MKQITSILLAFLCSFASIAQSGPLKEVDPATVGISKERLSRIDNVLQEYVDKKLIAGGVAIVAQDGKIIYHKAIGYNDDDRKVAMKKDVIFRIASQTKAITSVGIMMLYEEGKLMLNDPVWKFVPEFKNQQVLDKFNAKDTTYTTVPAKRAVTIRDLLTHTSGIGYAQIGTPESNAIYYKHGVVGGIGVDKIVLGDKMKILGTLPLMHQPGEKWLYGLNTDLLGYIIEVVSGLSLDEFFRKRIFEPLGMKDTYFYLPKSKQARMASLFSEDSLGHARLMQDTFVLNGKMIRDFPAMEGTYFSGGGGLSSTALDYAIFLQMMLNKGEYNGKRILSPTSVRMMTVSQYDQIPWPANKFGLGFSVYTEKSEATSPLSAGSFDWGGMFSSTYWVDPKKKIIAQLMLNQFPNSHGEIHDKFKILVYQAIN